MIRRLVILSGPVCSGKSSLANHLRERFDFAPLTTADLLREQSGNLNIDRAGLQKLGEKLDKKDKGKWVVSALIRHPKVAKAPDIVVDSVRFIGQLDRLREGFGRAVVHVHLTAPLPTLERRYEERSKGLSGEFTSYSQLRKNKTERNIESLADVADIVIETHKCTPADILTRVAGHLGLFGRECSQLVDVIVGGQYGSEGKGQISAYLSREYDFLVRVGGPNAGHKVYERPEPYTFHHLPSGTRASANSKLVIGPGAVIHPHSLLQEIADCGVDFGRLFIDPGAMIIEEADRLRELQLVKDIASTGQGVGAATARRILDRGAEQNVVLAKDVSDLKPYLRETASVLQEAYAGGKRVMLEGTQGTLLSLYHGAYPHVTSRDTTVSGCLAEAGIGPRRVRRVVLVCRTYPIRVGAAEGGKSSGDLCQELSFEEIAERSGIDVEELRSHERTSTTNRQRRIGEFDWSLLCKAVQLNNPTDIALTFADYISVANRKARRFEQLTPPTIRFIQEIERISNAPVSLVSTRFHWRSVIDKRVW